MKNRVKLVRATHEDVGDYIRIEKSVESPLNLVTTDPDDAKNEITHSIAWMVRLDNVVVGIAAYHTRSPKHAYIAEISVEPKYQKLGIGSEVLSKLIDILRAKGFESVELTTHEKNPALSLWKRSGFDVTGGIENYEDSRTSRLVMSRTI